MEAAEKKIQSGVFATVPLHFCIRNLGQGVAVRRTPRSIVQDRRQIFADELTTRLTFDVIGKVIMDADLNAQPDHQAEVGELVKSFEALVEAYNGNRLTLPWWLNLGKTRRRAALSSCITSSLQSIVSRKHAELQNKEEEKGTEGSRIILSMALQDVVALTPRVMEETCDQLRTFLFAGHDSTATLLS